MLTILTLKMLLMIVYLAHWDWILTQSRKDIVSNINDSKFMAICPFDRNEIELGNYYKETIDWKLNRNKIFDFWGIKNLRNIIKDLNSDDIVHVFTLKSGLLFAFANLFRNNKTKNILTITGLGYLFSDNFKAKILKILLGFFIKRLVNKNFDFLMYQNLAGDLDNGNPDSLSESQLNEIKNSNFINYLGHIDIKKELQNFDINIVMSKYEGSSRILLESLYVGLICLSNNIPGTSEVSSKFRNSFFIDENNIEEFRRSLDEIINHDAFSDNTQNILFGEDAKYNRELIDENYTSVKIAAAYNKIYRYLRREIESYKSEFI